MSTTVTRSAKSDATQARIFVGAIKRYTAALEAGRDLSRVRVSLDAATARIADRLASVNRAYHYRDLALAGHGRAAVRYFVALQVSQGVEVDVATEF